MRRQRLRQCGPSLLHFLDLTRPNFATEVDESDVFSERRKLAWQRVQPNLCRGDVRVEVLTPLLRADLDA